MSKSSAVMLFWGDDEFLLRRAALEFLAERGLRATEVDSSEWRGGETSDLATPSLWGEQRALLVTRCQALPEEGTREIRGYVAAPSPDTFCVLTLVSRARSLPPLAKFVQSSRGLVRQIAVKRQDLPRWILERTRLPWTNLSSNWPQSFLEPRSDPNRSGLSSGGWASNGFGTCAIERSQAGSRRPCSSFVRSSNRRRTLCWSSAASPHACVTFSGSRNFPIGCPQPKRPRRRAFGSTGRCGDTGIRPGGSRREAS